MKITSKICAATFFALVFILSSSAGECQEEKGDPTEPSKLITETVKTIKEVEKLNQYLEMNANLQKENKDLKGQIASLSKQVGELTVQISTQNERLRQQLLALPKFEIRSKVIGPDSAMAVLQFGDKYIRIRENMKMDVPSENGLWTLMEVVKISKDVVELNFTELDRRITIYD